MARAYGCDLRAVLAGAVICWAVADGVAVAQEGAEATEELGSSYLLARRTTGQGSIIETLLFDGQTIVTEIAVPAPDTGITAGTTGARTLPGSANALPGGVAALPPGFASGFGGTWLTGEVVDDYLVLHRIRATDPVTHEISARAGKSGLSPKSAHRSAPESRQVEIHLCSSPPRSLCRAPDAARRRQDPRHHGAWPLHESGGRALRRSHGAAAARRWRCDAVGAIA